MIESISIPLLQTVIKLCGERKFKMTEYEIEVNNLANVVAF